MFYEQQFFYPSKASGMGEWELSAKVRIETRYGSDYGDVVKKIWFIGVFDKSGNELALERGEILAGDTEISCDWTNREKPIFIIKDHLGNIVLHKKIDLSHFIKSENTKEKPAK
jgi:hypothetical protein